MPLIGPALFRIRLAVRRKTRKYAVEVLRIFEVETYQRCRIGIVYNVFLKKRIAVPALAVYYVSDQAAQKSDVRAGPDLCMDIAKGRRPCEARVNMHQNRTMVCLGLKRPPEGDRV